MAEHTPTPWIAASKFSSVVGVPVVAQTGESICNTSLPGLPDEWPDHRKRRSEANAAFIVNAVNSHDALVKALNDIRELANGPGMPRSLLDQIFGIATKARRAALQEAGR